MPVSDTPPRSGLLVDTGEGARDLLRDLQADNDELRETNRQLIAAMEEVQSLNVTLQSVNEALHATNVELRGEVDRSRSRMGDLERMMNGMDVAAMLLGEELELRDYNAMASRFFTLEKQDIGRSIARIRHELGQISLANLCREALGSGEPLERRVTDTAGALVSLIIRELDLGGSVTGLLITVREVDRSPTGAQERVAPRVG